MIKKVCLISLVLLGCTSLGVWLVQALSPARSPASAPVKIVDSPQYQRYSLPTSEVHTIKVPAQSRFKVSIAVAPALKSIQDFAQLNAAIAVINGGFFDPSNAKTTSYLIKNGKPIGDPQQNEHLTSNPDLKPYLTRIWNRSEFRRYQCGDQFKATIAPHSAAGLSGCQLVDAIGGGPQLLPKFTAVEEGFVDPATGRDAIGVDQRNARSAIGLLPDGSIVLVMAAQKPGQRSGMTLNEMINFMQRLGVEQAMNLDGGSSAALVYRNQTFYGKLNEANQPVARSIKSVILVHE